MSRCSCFAVCSDNDLYSDSRREKEREKCWPFTAYSLTSQNAVNLLQPHLKTDKMFCQSVFVRRGSWATWQCRRIPRCHTLLLHPWLISIGLWWQHLTHDRQRPSLPLIPGEPIWQQADLTDWLTHILTNWQTDRRSCSQEGCDTTQMISREDKQAADWR